MKFLEIFKAKASVQELGITLVEASKLVDAESIVYESGLVKVERYGELYSTKLEKTVSRSEFARYTINDLTDNYSEVFAHIDLRHLELKNRYSIELDLYIQDEVGHRIAARIYNVNKLEQYSESLWLYRTAEDRVFPSKIYSISSSQNIFPFNDQYTSADVTAVNFRIISGTSVSKTTLTFQ
jgi:hypothetical protein